MGALLLKRRSTPLPLLAVQKKRRPPPPQENRTVHALLARSYLIKLIVLKIDANITVRDTYATCERTQ